MQNEITRCEINHYDKPAWWVLSKKSERNKCFFPKPYWVPKQNVFFPVNIQCLHHLHVPGPIPILRIVCQHGVIDISYAFYGRANKDTCPMPLFDLIWSTNCVANKAEMIVKNRKGWKLFYQFHLIIHLMFQVPFQKFVRYPNQLQFGLWGSLFWHL